MQRVQPVNIPNTITIFRILLVPALIYCLLHDIFAAAILIFLAAGFSDALDGYLARRLRQLTHLGALLDPLADKLLIVSSVLILAFLAQLPWWLALIILSRDMLILAAATISYFTSGKSVMQPSILSKINTFVQLTLIFFVLANAAGFPSATTFLNLLFYLALTTTLLSGGHYAVHWLKNMRSSG
jgi:cardiolipin synthase (CMP-forming)